MVGSPTITDLFAVPGNGQVTLSFTAPAGASSVKLMQKTGDGSFAENTSVVLTASSTGAMVTGLINGTAYTFKLVVVGGSYGGDSNVIIVTPTAPPANAAPTFTSATISGEAKVGLQLTAAGVGYSDTESDPAGSPQYQWMICGTADGIYTDISGATQATYTLLAVDNGKYIKVRVTPVATSGTLTGTAVQSTAVRPVTATAAPKPFTVNTSFKVNQTDNAVSLTANALLDAKTIVTNNQTSGSQRVLVIVALYNNNNTMLNIAYLAKEVMAGATEIFHAGFTLPADVQGNKVRVFVWDGEDFQSSPMHPLSDVTQIHAQ